MIPVTPFAGVWIEIKQLKSAIGEGGSLPSRECGLKFGIRENDS